MSVEVVFDLHLNEVTEEVRVKVKGIVTHHTQRMSQQAQRNVSGPRPTKLGVRSGNLISTIRDQTTVMDNAEGVAGEVGSDAQSYKGFPYAAYWEGIIPQGKGKHNPWSRPFAEPALQAVKDGYLNDMSNLM